MHSELQNLFSNLKKYICINISPHAYGAKPTIFSCIGDIL